MAGEATFTRKAFIAGVAITGVTSGVLGVLGEFGVTAELDSGQHIESVFINGKKVDFLVTPHIPGYYNIDAIVPYVNSHEIIIPEYFPYEYDLLKRDKTLGRSITNFDNQQNVLFQQLNEQCIKEKKKVWVVDPAYNLDFGYFELANASAISFFMSMANSKLWKFSRRNLMAIFAQITTSAYLYPKLLMSVEEDFRSCITAEHLSQLTTPSDYPEKGTLVVYPPLHAKNIIGYLKDEKSRTLKLQLYQAVYGHLWSSLFRRRFYDFSN